MDIASADVFGQGQLREGSLNILYRLSRSMLELERTRVTQNEAPFSGMLL
jgi:hypothetical protein